MKRIVFSLILALAIPVIALAQEKAGQSKDEQEILKTRSEWLEAYYKGDTETLARIETSDFVVIHDRVIENRRVYPPMQNAAKAGRWFPKGSANIDTELRVRVQGNVAVVSGRGWDKIPGRIEEPPQNIKAYSEVWVNQDGRWRIMHLHFDRQDSPRQPSSDKSQTAAPTPGQPAFPVGTYTAKDQDGAWVMSFRSDGTFTVKMDDRVIVPGGKYTVKNDQVVLSNGIETLLCGAGDGIYKWSFDGQALTFGAVSDTGCMPRQRTLTGNKFIKQ
jgi:ketosteroid isomerase-like protein